MEADVEEYENWRNNIPDEKCTLCDGAGELNGKCVVCSGRGAFSKRDKPPSVRESDEPLLSMLEEIGAFSDDAQTLTCRVCDGTGTLVQVKCHGCDGKGERETIEAAYPMHVEVIKEFTEFCKNSGGFSIF
jgi:RecJ-like exonuclease